MIEKEIERNETKENICEENMRNLPLFFILPWHCIWSLKRIDPFVVASITYHRIFHSLLFPLFNSFPTLVCLFI